MYQADGDCVQVGVGYYSPALDNAVYSCSYSDELPAPLQLFSSRGGGTDSCSVSPRIQSYLVGGDESIDAVVAPLPSTCTLESWVHWGESASHEVPLFGVSGLWHFSLTLDADGARMALDVQRVSSSEHAPLNTTMPPWLDIDQWHHVAAVVDQNVSCFFVDAIRVGCVAFAGGGVHVADTRRDFFAGGSNDVGGSGLLNGMMDEIRIHRSALASSQLGFHQTRLALNASCSHGDLLCDGRCVAGCLGDSRLDRSSCSCVCPDALYSLDLTSGRCRPPCAGTTQRTGEEACGCAADSYKVWRGRYLGISSPSTASADELHCWGCGSDETIGLREVVLFDSRLDPIEAQACWELSSGEVVSGSQCAALFDGVTRGAQYLSAQPGGMRVIVDLGREVDVSRIELFNYDKDSLSSRGVRRIELYVQPDGGEAPSERVLFQPRYAALANATVQRAAEGGAAVATHFDSREHTDPFSGTLSCARCGANSSGS